MILLKTFSEPLIWDYSPSSIPVIFRFHPFFSIMSLISWVFYTGSILYLAFSLTDASISSVVPSKSEILSFIPCILLVMVATIVSVRIPKL